MSNELMNRVQINEITGGRDQAIAKWMMAYDAYHQLTKEAASLSIGGAVNLQVPQAGRYEDAAITEAFLSSKPHHKRDHETGRYNDIPARDYFSEKITQTIDRRCWRHLLETLGFDQLLDRQAREEFEKDLNSGNPLPFTEDNCRATFAHIWENRRDLYLRGIANAFSALDRRFRVRTH